MRTLRCGVVSEPKRSALQGLDSKRLTWFEERVESGPVAGLAAVFGSSSAADIPLPPARYAVDLQGGRETVVYGEAVPRGGVVFYVTEVAGAGTKLG